MPTERCPCGAPSEVELVGPTGKAALCLLHARMFTVFAALVGVDDVQRRPLLRRVR